MPSETRSLHRKLAEVMVAAERIPKNGTYTGQGGFKYVMVGDAADAIRKALGERKVSMLPSAVELVGETEHETRSGGTMTTLTIRTTWTLVDGDSGETAVIQSIGTGADAGDKASPKAQTNAMKYALLMGFLLSTGDDPEQYDSSDRKPVTTQSLNAEERERFAAAHTTDDGGMIGTAIAQGTQDFELRQTPDGFTLPFRVKNGSKSFIVLAENRLAEALNLIKPRVIGQRVTVWGHWTDETIPAKGTKPQIKYRILHLERIETPDGMLPPADEPEPVEAPSIQIFEGMD